MGFTFCRFRTAYLLSTSMSLVGLAVSANAQTVLIDFGTDSSFRGLSVENPDSNGNHWNNFTPGDFVLGLIDVADSATNINFGFSTPIGFDSFNGPAGPTDASTLETNVMFTDIDAAALGDLGGALEAAFDYFAGTTAAEPDNASRFEIQQLDSNSIYTLTFFGSHKFSTDDATAYTVYTDNTYTTPVDSVSLNVQEPGAPDRHNRDQVATLSNLSPQTDNILYVEFIGEFGGAGYLNAMQIEVFTPAVAGDYNEDGVVNAADYVVYRNNVGSNVPLPNDGGTALPVGEAHYDYWQTRFGNTSGGGVSAAIPEPSTWLLLSLLTCSTLWSRRFLQMSLGPKRHPLTAAP